MNNIFNTKGSRIGYVDGTDIFDTQNYHVGSYYSGGDINDTNGQYVGRVDAQGYVFDNYGNQLGYGTGTDVFYDPVGYIGYVDYPTRAAIGARILLLRHL